MRIADTDQRGRPPVADFAEAGARAGQVRRAGRTITFADGEARAIGADGARKPIAMMAGALMTARSRDGIQS